MKTNNSRISSLFFNFSLALLLTVPFTTSVLAATSADGFWNDIAPSRIALTGQRQTIPERYRTTELAMPRFEAALAKAPPEKSADGGVLISLPMPDGSFQNFRVESSPIMEPELALANPDITTYIAVADDNAAIMARLDLTPAGFHAIIFTLYGTVYIDPYQTGSRLQYISYNKQDLSRKEPFHCGVTGELVDASHGLRDHIQMAPVGNVLNTYRLAVAATGEYTAFHGGTVALGLAAIVTTINRVTGIYERELSVRLLLVANNNLIVYTNSVTDPYSNYDPFALLAENQTNLDNVIESANYDIGHVFSTGGGGLAGLGVVCNNSWKAQGETGLGQPVGDVFSVDYVAHEMGHQFGGNHTFNGSSSSCAGGNRNASTAYEPGSGSTIQAYAGICPPENLQSNSDDYFHTISFDEMISHVLGAGNCGTPSNTGNTAPAIDAGPGFTVPSNTPLVLDAAVAVDPDNGQVHTYSWEQFDLGAAGPPNTDDSSRPIFRSFMPRPSPVRYLPQMSDILNNTSTLGESLPTTDRALTFRLTVRDNAAGGGGVDHSTVVHQVTTSAGPFAVTSQNTPTDWAGNTGQTVTWDVANTTATPVSCPNVGIYYSDSGFPNFSTTVLLASTLNDGSETITAPNSSTTTGRVMVKCNSNIFFDINNADITITTDTFSIGGTVSGLAGAGLQLQINAGEILGIGADGVFTFAAPLVDGNDYSVTVLTQPTNLSQTCSVTNDSGTLSGANIDNVTVTCVTNTYTVGGNVSGLAGAGLQLQINAGEILGIGADGVFTFAAPLVDGSDYAVTVLTQPGEPDQACEVSDGSGTISGVDITNIDVTCVGVDPEILFSDGFED